MLCYSPEAGAAGQGFKSQHSFLFPRMSIFHTKIHQLLLPSCFRTNRSFLLPAVPRPVLLPQSELAPREDVLFARGDVKVVTAAAPAQPTYREPHGELPRLPPCSLPPHRPGPGCPHLQFWVQSPTH